MLAAVALCLVTGPQTPTPAGPGTKPAAPAVTKQGAPAATKPADAAAALAGSESDAALAHRLDLALERFYARDYAQASGQLFSVLQALPEQDPRRDNADFHLGASLVEMGLVQGGVEHIIDVVSGRRSPDLVAQGLGALDPLMRKGELDEARLIDDVLFGNQYGDLPPDTTDFVEYHQALGELRRGFAEWGTRRLVHLASSPRYWGFRARYALAVELLDKGRGDDAEALLQKIVEAPAAPGAVKNDARLALARELYERHQLPAAFTLYAAIDSPLPAQDVVLLEKAWTKVADRDEPRALGLLVGLGAPVYGRLFAPERSLVRAMALDRLCQFRAARLEVTSFKKNWAETLKRIHEQLPLEEDRRLLRAAESRPELVATRKWRDRLRSERARLGKLDDDALRKHLEAVYDLKLHLAEARLSRALPRTLAQVAEELVSVDERMTALDYEIGVGLWKRIGAERGAERVDRPVSTDIPASSERVYFRFEGEYWSDELNDFWVRAPDRCVR
jgi:hypothetical protein